MALTKVNRGGLNTGISDSSDATFLTVDSSEQAIIKSEGGTVTTSVQQGLAKVWCALNGQGTIAIRDSFNTASLTDTGTGAHTVTYTSAFGTVEYAVTLSHQESQANNAYTGHATNSVRTDSRNDAGTFFDITHKSVAAHGDLA